MPRIAPAPASKAPMTSLPPPSGCAAPPEERCCGLPMDWQEIFGIRRYECRRRGHHPAIYVNLNTGQRVSDKDLPYLGGTCEPA